VDVEVGELPDAHKRRHYLSNSSFERFLNKPLKKHLKKKRVSPNWWGSLFLEMFNRINGYLRPRPCE
jgi:hypothetical protein